MNEFSISLAIAAIVFAIAGNTFMLMSISKKLERIADALDDVVREGAEINVDLGAGNR